jgi:hypothetical protein
LGGMAPRRVRRLADQAPECDLEPHSLVLTNLVNILPPPDGQPGGLRFESRVNSPLNPELRQDISALPLDPIKSPRRIKFSETPHRSGEPGPRGGVLGWSQSDDGGGVLQRAQGARRPTVSSVIDGREGRGSHFGPSLCPKLLELGCGAFSRDEQPCA